jgi:hypothetical protein
MSCAYRAYEFHLQPSYLPKMNSRIEIVMLRLVYTENVMMFWHSGRELRRLENLVFTTIFVCRISAAWKIFLPIKDLSESSFVILCPHRAFAHASPNPPGEGKLGWMQSRSPSMPVRRLRVGIALEKSNWFTLDFQREFYACSAIVAKYKQSI